MSNLQDLRVQILDSVILALREDIGSGDITTNSIIPSDKKIAARITAKEAGVICGLSIAQLVFRSVDKDIDLTLKVKDGAAVSPGKVIAIVRGPARGILTAERTALNFLQHMSGIASLTAKYVKAAGKKVKILDTRKTSPGLRALDKYAVKTGGGANHRLGLFDAVLIKDNHITVVGGLKKAVNLARNRYGAIEVEAKTLKQVKEAINTAARRILLDNMSLGEIKQAVKLIKSAGRKIEIEASGGINLGNIGKIARTGVDFISVGILTHSAPALDISLKVI
jgi:nicotinate-nucleotide pyrophosphorylase (carboxylating)